MFKDKRTERRKPDKDKQKRHLHVHVYTQSSVYQKYADSFKIYLLAK